MKKTFLGYENLEIETASQAVDITSGASLMAGLLQSIFGCIQEIVPYARMLDDREIGMGLMKMMESVNEIDKRLVEVREYYERRIPDLPLQEPVEEA